MTLHGVVCSYPLAAASQKKTLGNAPCPNIVHPLNLVFRSRLHCNCAIFNESLQKAPRHCYVLQNNVFKAFIVFIFFAACRRQEESQGHTSLHQSARYWWDQVSFLPWNFSDGFLKRPRSKFDSLCNQVILYQQPLMGTVCLSELSDTAGVFFLAKVKLFWTTWATLTTNSPPTPTQFKPVVFHCVAPFKKKKKQPCLPAFGMWTGTLLHLWQCGSTSSDLWMKNSLVFASGSSARWYQLNHPLLYPAPYFPKSDKHLPQVNLKSCHAATGFHWSERKSRRWHF